MSKREASSSYELKSSCATRNCPLATTPTKQTFEYLRAQKHDLQICNQCFQNQQRELAAVRASRSRSMSASSLPSKDLSAKPNKRRASDHPDQPPSTKSRVSSPKASRSSDDEEDDATGPLDGRVRYRALNIGQHYLCLTT